MPADELQRKILNYVRLNGPLLPIKVAKFIEKDTLFASAMLASLISSGQIKITRVKIGGSPLYYVKGQEEKLQDLSKYLHDREKEAYELLKKNSILRDTDLKPVQRIALREIKDYAVPIIVKDELKKELFWKWYLISDDKAKELITNYLKQPSIKKPEIKEEIKKPMIKKPEQIEEVKKPEPKKPKELQKKLDKLKKVKSKQKDDFQEIINLYTKQNQIKVLKQKIIRKNKEIDMIVKLPSKIGSLRFYVKSKNKKTVTNADLSLAYNEGQRRNLPILFLTTGKPTKKALDYIEKNLNNRIILKQVK
jgi:hypothetical protein